MGKAEENKQQKRQSLMDAAFRLYTTRGIAHTAVADIAGSAGVAKGTFYLYFQDKYDLQEQLILRKAEEVFQHALERSGGAAEREPVERVIAIMNDIIDQLAADHTLLRFISKNLGWGVFSKALNRSPVDFLGTLGEILGAKDRQRLVVTLYTVIELVSGTCHSVILENMPVSLAEYRPVLERSVRAILREEYGG